MNSIDWLQSVRKNTPKPLIPPDPPMATAGKNAVKTLIPPVAPGSSVYLFKNENFLEEGVEEKICAIEGKVETSGGHRGNSTNHRGNDDLDHTGDRGNQGNPNIPEIKPSPDKPRLPYMTPGGTLVIPMESPERYHWWKLDGERMSVDETRAEVVARMAAERGNHAD